MAAGGAVTVAAEPRELLLHGEESVLPVHIVNAAREAILAAPPVRLCDGHRCKRAVGEDRQQQLRNGVGGEGEGYGGGGALVAEAEAARRGE